jgi:hypothetical protein
MPTLSAAETGSWKGCPAMADSRKTFPVHPYRPPEPKLEVVPGQRSAIGRAAINHANGAAASPVSPPAADGEQPGVDREQPGVDGEQPVAERQQSAVDGGHPAADGERPASATIPVRQVTNGAPVPEAASPSQAEPADPEPATIAPGVAGSGGGSDPLATGQGPAGSSGGSGGSTILVGAAEADGRDSKVVTGREQPASMVTGRELVAIGSALLLLLFLIKIYGVARYSLTTTTALLAATPVQVALGTVTIYAYFVLPAIALGTLWFAVRFRARVQPALWPLILIIASVTALASPYKYLLQGLAVVLAALCVELVVRHVRHRLRDSADERLVQRYHRLSGWQGLSVVYLGAAALAFQFMHSLDVPWVSAQAFLLNGSAVTTTQDLFDGANRLKVQPESRFVGYPIAETEEWLTVLHVDTRYVMRIPQSAVDTRLTCHNEDDQLSGDQPLLEALQGNTYSSPNLDCREVLRYLSQKVPGQPLPTSN